VCGDESYDTYPMQSQNLNQILTTFTLIIKDVINSSSCKNLNYYCTQGFNKINKNFVVWKVCLFLTQK
jgi:hypothetical protein